MASVNISDSLVFVGPLVHSSSLETLHFVDDGILVVNNGKIIVVQNHSDNLEDIQKLYRISDQNVHKLQKGQFLIPGFIDTHIHGPQYPNIGLGYDLPLLNWLQKYTFPLEKKFSDTVFAEKVYNAVVKKTLANGTTTACYFATIHKDSSVVFAKCIKNLGQRAFVGKVNMNINSPSDYIETYEESVEQTEAFIKEILSLKSFLIKPIVTPRFALSCDMKLMKKLAELAADYDIPIQTHANENVEEIKLVQKEYHQCKNYVDVYDKAGLITDKTILAHGIYLDYEELDVIKKSQTTISHCASSNILLQSGVCPVRKYLDIGLKMSLGTDCSGGSSCSMLDCIRQTMSVSTQAAMTNKGNPLTFDEVFYLATLGGAEALHLGDTTGNFLPGKDFDAILVDLTINDAVDLLEEYNLQQLFQKFIYLGDDRVIKKVFVAGQVVKNI